MTKWDLSQECRIDLTFENQQMWPLYYQTKKENYIIISINVENIWKIER
jgi:hypothetical protein